MDIARQAVELGDHQPVMVALAFLHGGFQLRAVFMAAAGFDFYVFAERRLAGEAGDSLALGFEAEAGAALFFSGNAVVGDKICPVSYRTFEG